MLVLFLLVSVLSYAQTATVRAHAAVMQKVGSKPQNADVVVWLSPLQTPLSPYTIAEDSKPARLVQKNKMFDPHLLVIRAGGASALLDVSVGDLLEGIVLHAFDGKAPFSAETLRRIRDLKEIYGLDLDASASHRMRDKR